MCKNKEELSAQIIRYRKLAAESKKIETELTAVKDDIMTYVKAKGKPKAEGSSTLVVFGDGYKVSIIIANNATFDTDKLKAALGEDLSPYKKNTTYSKLDVR